MNSFYNAFLVEKQKHKKTWLILAAVLLFYTFFLHWQMDRDAYRPQGWIMLLYDLPVLNAIVLPLTMAVLASQIMDVEHKGNTWKLLESLQSKSSLLWCKIVYGLCAITLFTLFQTVIALSLGYLCHYEGSPDWLSYGLYFRNTLAVTFVLYLLQLLLSLIFANQAVAISTGICGSMAGLFILYLPISVLYEVIPWGLYGATSFVRMDWDPATRIISYSYERVLDDAFVWVMFWMAALLFVGHKLFERLETEGLALKRKLQKESSPGPEETFTADNPRAGAFRTFLPAEWIKLKRTPIWIAFLVLPLISALIGTFNYMGNIEVLTEDWYSLWSQHTLFSCLLFQPALIGVCCSYLWRMEHTGTNWNQIKCLASPWKIVKDKLLVSALLAALMQLWLLILFIAGGIYAGLSLPLPRELTEWMLCGLVGSIAVCSIQLFLSLVIRSFAVPIGIAILCSVGGLFLANRGMWYLTPHFLLGLGMRANNPFYQINIPAFLAVCAAYLTTTAILSVQYILRHDVITSA